MRSLAVKFRRTLCERRLSDLDSKRICWLQNDSSQTWAPSVVVSPRQRENARGCQFPAQTAGRPKLAVGHGKYDTRTSWISYTELDLYERSGSIANAKYTEISKLNWTSRPCFSTCVFPPLYRSQRDPLVWPPQQIGRWFTQTYIYRPSGSRRPKTRPA